MEKFFAQMTKCSKKELFDSEALSALFNKPGILQHKRPTHYFKTIIVILKIILMMIIMIIVKRMK